MPDPKPDLVPWDAPTTSTPLAEILRMKEEGEKYGVPFLSREELLRLRGVLPRDPADAAEWEDFDVE